MGLFAKCTGYLEDTFRDGTATLSQSKLQNKNNDYSALNCFAPGIEINPADGEYLIVTKINDSNSFMVTLGGINQNVSPSCDRGERKIYSVSSDGSEIAASAHFKNDGSIEINDTDKANITLADDGTLTLNDSQSAYMTFDTSGNIVMNGGGYSSVRYAPLDTSIQSIITAVNAEFAKLLTVTNAMVSAFSALGYTISPYVQTTITADNSAAESATIQIS